MSGRPHPVSQYGEGGPEPREAMAPEPRSLPDGHAMETTEKLRLLREPTALPDRRFDEPGTNIPNVMNGGIIRKDGMNHSEAGKGAALAIALMVFCTQETMESTCGGYPRLVTGLCPYSIGRTSWSCVKGRGERRSTSIST